MGSLEAHLGYVGL